MCFEKNKLPSCSIFAQEFTFKKSCTVLVCRFISIYLRLVQKKDDESNDVGSSSSSNSRVNVTQIRKKQTRKWVYATFRFFMMRESGEVLAESARIKKPNKFEIHTGEYSWGYPKFMSVEGTSFP